MQMDAINTVEKLIGVGAFLIACQTAQMEAMCFKKFRDLQVVAVHVLTRPLSRLVGIEN